MIEVRQEQPSDYEHVFKINARAFETDEEARLVERLRNIDPHISLVAEVDGQIAGHIMFTPVTLNGERTKFAGLAPMAVLPEFQNRGIGSKLVAEGLNACREAHCTAVFVLGHPNYYPRFGFTVAKLKGLSCEYPAPDEAFMVLELENGSLKGKRGLIKYDPAFDQA